MDVVVWKVSFWQIFLLKLIILYLYRSNSVDVWDGNEEPEVYHGHTMTSKIFLRGVLEVIAESAFTRSNYPIILSIENHLSKQMQSKMARLMRSIFKERLFTANITSNNVMVFPSPNQLKGYIFIKGSKSEIFELPPEDKYNGHTFSFLKLNLDSNKPLVMFNNDIDSVNNYNDTNDDRNNKNLLETTSDNKKMHRSFTKIKSMKKKSKEILSKHRSIIQGDFDSDDEDVYFDDENDDDYHDNNSKEEIEFTGGDNNENNFIERRQQKSTIKFFKKEKKSRNFPLKLSLLRLHQYEQKHQTNKASEPGLENLLSSTSSTLHHERLSLLPQEVLSVSVCDNNDEIKDDLDNEVEFNDKNSDLEKFDSIKTSNYGDSNKEIDENFSSLINYFKTRKFVNIDVCINECKSTKF